MKILIDFTNTPHVNFFLPIIRYFERMHQFIFTARDFSETPPLFDRSKIDYKLIGLHKGKNRIRKAFGMASRIVSILRQVPKFDLSPNIYVF